MASFSISPVVYNRGVAWPTSHLIPCDSCEKSDIHNVRTRERELIAFRKLHLTHQYLMTVTSLRICDIFSPCANVYILRTSWVSNLKGVRCRKVRIETNVKFQLHRKRFQISLGKTIAGGALHQCYTFVGWIKPIDVNNVIVRSLVIGKSRSEPSQQARLWLRSDLKKIHQLKQKRWNLYTLHRAKIRFREHLLLASIGAQTDLIGSSQSNKTSHHKPMK